MLDDFSLDELIELSPPFKSFPIELKWEEEKADALDMEFDLILIETWEEPVQFLQQ